MARRTIKASCLTKTVSDLVREAAFTLPGPVARLVDRAILREKSASAKQVLGAILANKRLARSMPLPLCQDTGMVEVFLEIGHRVFLDLEDCRDLEEAVSAGAAAACRDYLLRASVVDPLSRDNTGNNAPAVVHQRLVAGSRLAVRVMLKGFGSENMSRLACLSPGADPADIVNFVVESVRLAGGNPCPPVIVGCGLGGTVDKAVLLAREVLLEPEKLLRPNPDRQLRGLERETLARINRLGIGPGGLGGRTTALAVRMGRFPTHIAGLPVAVNISCWALRVASTTIEPDNSGTATGF